MRTLLRKQAELEALVEDEDQIAPVKAEAYRELIALYDYEKFHGKRVRDNAQKASDAVGRAIKRLCPHFRISAFCFLPFSPPLVADVTAFVAPYIVKTKIYL